MGISNSSPTHQSIEHPSSSPPTTTTTCPSLESRSPSASVPPVVSGTTSTPRAATQRLPRTSSRVRPLRCPLLSCLASSQAHVPLESKADQQPGDMHKVSANVKSHVPGRSPNAERDGTHLGAQAGAKIDTAIAEADKQAGRAKSNVESYAKDAKAEALKGIDKFDQKVEEGSAKAKGWFGGK